MKGKEQRRQTVGYIVMCDDSALYWSHDGRFYRAGGPTPVTVFANRRTAQARIKKSAAEWTNTHADSWARAGEYRIVRAALTAAPNPPARRAAAAAE